MSPEDVGVVAGMFSTSLFVLSYLPMLVKAARTKDLSSYSPGNLIIANVGNVVHSVYVVTLPLGPIWFLHAFYTASTALMLLWYVRFGRRRFRAGASEAAGHVGTPTQQLESVGP